MRRNGFLKKLKNLASKITFKRECEIITVEYIPKKEIIKKIQGKVTTKFTENGKLLDFLLVLNRKLDLLEDQDKVVRLEKLFCLWPRNFESVGCDSQCNEGVTRTSRNWRRTDCNVCNLSHFTDTFCSEVHFLICH
jgi:hypothetical protein